MSIENRPQITEKEVKTAISVLIQKLNERIKQKGTHAFASTHEIYGVLAEEFKELLDAIHDTNPPEESQLYFIKEELLDIAVAAIFSYACIHSNKIDW